MGSLNPSSRKKHWRTQFDLVNPKVMRVTMMKMAMLEMVPIRQTKMMLIFWRKQMRDDNYIMEDQVSTKVCDECPLVHGVQNTRFKVVCPYHGMVYWLNDLDHGVTLS